MSPTTFPTSTAIGPCDQSALEVMSKSRMPFYVDSLVEIKLCLDIMCLHVCMHNYVHLYACMCVCVYMSVCISACILAYVCMYLCIGNQTSV